MKTDAQLKQDAIDELHWDPAVDSSQINVAVHDRVVTLSGSVPSYAKKIAVEKAIQRMKGVRAFAIDLAVKAPAHEAQSDDATANAVRAMLDSTDGLPRNAIHVTVQRGCVTLTGTLDWGHQRRAAEIAAGRARGVVGIVNKIALRAEADPTEIRTRIDAALKRRAQSEAVAAGQRIDRQLQALVHALLRRGTAGLVVDETQCPVDLFVDAVSPRGDAKGGVIAEDKVHGAHGLGMDGARVAPQLSILQLAFPIQIAIGLLTLLASLPLVAATLGGWSGTYDGMVGGVLRVLAR